MTINISYIYKFFHREEHANDLANGRIWISTLEECRAYENTQRGDKDEGKLFYNSGVASGTMSDPDIQTITGRLGISVQNSRDFKFNIGNNLVTSKVEDAYVFCTTEEYRPDILSKDFGDYCVRIKRPELLHKHLHKLMTKRIGDHDAYFGKVLYRERSYMGVEPKPPAPLGFIKPMKYYEQKEVRMLWQLVDKNGQVLRLNEQLKPILLECPDIKRHFRRIA